MNKSFLIVSEDTFYLTFLAAWFSTKQNLFADTYGLIFLLLGVICFATLVAQIKHYVSLRLGPLEYTSMGYKPLVMLGMTAFAIVSLLIIVLYFAWKNVTYLKDKDITVLIIFAVMWLLVPIFELILNQYEVSVQKRKRSGD